MGSRLSRRRGVLDLPKSSWDMLMRDLQIFRTKQRLLRSPPASTPTSAYDPTESTQLRRVSRCKPWYSGMRQVGDNDHCQVYVSWWARVRDLRVHGVGN